jgi:predicted ATP-grasp superfamily ATP-dependent carboligase
MHGTFAHSSGDDRDEPMRPGRRVLVLGDHRQSLVVARSLHLAGWHIVLGSAKPRSFTARSRHIGAWWHHPPYHDQTHGFDEALRAWLSPIAAGDSPVVFPIGDSDVACVVQRHAQQPLPGVVVAAPHEAVHTCLDKPALYRIAKQLDIPVADFVVVTARQLDEAVAAIGYPCVIKPASSLDDLGHLKAFVLDAPQPLDPSLAPSAGEGGAGWPLLIVQGKAEGVRHNCHFVAHHGVLLAYFEQSVQRTTRLDGSGNGVAGRSEPPSEWRRRACERLVARLDYSGPGCAQFLVEGADGPSWFLELNPRLDATCAIAVDCGYDLPGLALAEALHREAGAPPPARTEAPYPAGRKAVWTTGDLQALLGEMRTHRLGFRKALHWLCRLAVSFVTSDLHLTFSWDDPEPALYALAGLALQPIWQRLKRLLPLRRGATRPQA